MDNELATELADVQERSNLHTPEAIPTITRPTIVLDESCGSEDEEKGQDGTEDTAMEDSACVTRRASRGTAKRRKPALDKDVLAGKQTILLQESKISQLQAELEALRNQPDNLQLQSQNADLIKSLASYKSDNEALRKEQTRLYTRVVDAEFTASLAAARDVHESDSTQAENKRLRDQVAHQSMQLASANNATQHYKELHAYELSQREQMRFDLDAKHAQINSQQAEIQQMAKANQSFVQQHNSLHAERLKLRDENQRLRASMEDAVTARNAANAQSQSFVGAYSDAMVAKQQVEKLSLALKNSQMQIAMLNRALAARTKERNNGRDGGVKKRSHSMWQFGNEVDLEKMLQEVIPPPQAHAQPAGGEATPPPTPTTKDVSDTIMDLFMPS